ncbi:MAG: shikimate kinase AroL [Gemmataceae bacterium]|nr:shikimate kinase AroL [Gemmataceae bacterium]
MPALVFLVGYRGTGKTTVARMVAQHLGVDWIDADPLLEELHGKTIKQIFADEGEAGFRAKEAALLTALCQRDHCVIATGGGIVLQESNRAQMRQAGTVVWLTAGATTLWQRIQQDPTTTARRPNLTGGGLAEVEELLRVREPLYRDCAHLTIDTEDRSPEQVADAIRTQLAGEKSL